MSNPIFLQFGIVNFSIFISCEWFFLFTDAYFNLPLFDWRWIRDSFRCRQIFLQIHHQAAFWLMIDVFAGWRIIAQFKGKNLNNLSVIPLFW